VNGSALYQTEKVGTQSVAYGLTAGARAFRRIYTPLQREINLVIRVLLLFALFFELLLLLGALARQLPTVETLKMAVVIIGLVPNGLFLSISLAYALGAVRISGQGALVQQANSVESLSNVDVLCMDKTGTLTTNALRLERVHPLGIQESELRRLLGDYVASASVGNTTSAAIGAACPGQARHVREELPFSSAYKWSGLVMDDEAVRGTYILGAVEILAPALRAGSDLQAMVEQESAQGQRIRNGMRDILKLYLARVFYFVVLLSGASVVGGFPFEPKQASILVLLTVGIPTFLLAAWARPGTVEKDAQRSLWHFVLPAASTLGLV
jgi:cation-transporting ATPase E